MRHIAFFGIQLHGNDAAMLRGVFRYAQQCPDWMLHDPCMTGKWPTGPKSRPSGIIANVIDADAARYCASFRVPVVNISAPQPAIHSFPTVAVDTPAIGRMAAQHFLERGLRHVAWFDAMPDFPFIAERGTGFEALAHERGIPCFSYQVRFAQRDWDRIGAEVSDSAVADWLCSLPKPCGVFATTDLAGRDLCWLCHQMGINVPEDIAVVGVDDFDFICDTSWPSLSSVRLPNADIGFRAAELLDRLMSHRKAPPLSLFQPIDVHVRQSSDTIAIEDRHVAQALAFIRTHAQEHLDVQDVMRTCGLNRRALERGFRGFLGRTVLEEIHHARIALARKLLTDTDLSIGEIAVRSGFRDEQQMGLIFRKTLGISPTKCRRNAKTPEEH